MHFLRSCPCQRHLFHLQLLCLHDVAIVLQIISTCINYDIVRFCMFGWLNMVNQVFRWCPSMRSNLTESPRKTSRLLRFFIDESPTTTMFLFSTFGWWTSGWRSLKLTCSFSNLLAFWTFDSLFLSFRKVLFPVLRLILLSFVLLLPELLWARTFWAWISLLFCSRMVSISFCLFLTLLRIEEQKAPRPPINFSTVTSTNERISPQNFLYFNPFAALVSNFTAKISTSPKLLNLN